MATDDRGRGWIIAIAVFRLFKATILIAASIGALALIDRDLPALGDRLVVWLDVDRGDAIVDDIMKRLPGVSDRMLLGMGVGGLAYSALYLVEAYGLFRRRVWAEWLTVVATSVFIPFEIYELTKGATVLKVLVLVANVLIVAYLVYRRLRDRAQRKTRARGAGLVQSIQT